MSLKPPKKTDMSKAWMQKRRDDKRTISPEYHLIVTEGTKTEPEYFNSLKKRINEKYPERIQLDISGIGDNTVNLFERAKALAEENPNKYKHVWVIYDTDSFPAENINRVPVLCKNNSTSNCQYHALWSNQCIELWFLLHFSYMHSNLHRDEYYPKLDINLKTVSAGKYRKNRKDMFEVLLPYLDTAISNAKKLNILNGKKEPSKSAPGTQIYRLMEKMKFYLNS